jgi:ATP-binding cassette, subfamily B, bacterial
VITRDLHLLRRLFQEARPFWAHIAGVFLVSILAVPLALLTPVPLKLAVDNVIGHHPLPGFLSAVVPDGIQRSNGALLVLVSLMFAAVAALTQVQELLQTVLQTSTGEKLILRFRGRLFAQAQRLSLLYHDRVGTADSTYRVIEDSKAVQYIASDTLVSFVTALATLASMLYVTFVVDWQLALLAVAVVPLLGFVSVRFRRGLRTRSLEVKRLESGALSVVQEVLTGLRVVKAFSQEEREHERFYARASDGMLARVRLALAKGQYSLVVGSVIGVGGALVLYLGVRRVQSGAITLGDLLLVMGYLSQLFAPIKTMAKSSGALQNSLASAERAFELLDRETDVPERPGARPLERAHGRVAFVHVSFGYGPGRLALDDVSFVVEPETRVGIAGHSGAGKSTLVNLLMRLHDPSAGRIQLDGVDLRDYRLADLRRQLGIVLQDPVLFSASIAENIAYARPEATSREIEAAARAAEAHDFIAALPGGYDAQVGERGLRLSGGERQRISLARAFLTDAPLLILDEPTSSVDVRTEAAILAAMGRLMAGRTSFMIAHRASTLELCDLRLELAAGRLVEARPAAAPALASGARRVLG